MPRNRMLRVCATTLALPASLGLAGASSSAAVLPLSRTTASLPAAGQTLGLTRTPLPTTLPRELSGAAPLGPAPAGAPARALIALAHRNQSGLLRFIARVSTPGDRLYGHYLTPRQFTARYAPSAATVREIEAFTRSYGLRVAGVPSNRAYVYVTGTVAEFDRAFSTSILRYRLAGTVVQAPVRALSLPSRLARGVTGIDGLDTAAVERPLGLLSTPPAPAYVNAPPFSSYWGSSIDTQAPGAYGQDHLPDVVQGYTPQQIQRAYGIAPAIAHGLDGHGQTVAVIDAYSSPTIVQDAEQWSQLHGLPRPNLVVDDNAAERDAPEGPAVPGDVPVLGGLNLQDPQGWFGEESLDVEAVHTTAPGATIVVQSAMTPENIDFEMAQNRVVSRGEAQIISNSYGSAADTTDSTSDGYWQQAAAQGIGVYFSSGDSGDQTSGGTQPANRSVDGDPNSPYVTAVGGTTLAIGATDNYEFETYWGTDTATLSGGKWGPSAFQSGGGGGTSTAYGEPAYQKAIVPARYADYFASHPCGICGTGLPISTPADSALSTTPTIPGRVVPDVAMLGDPNSGFLMGMTEDFTAYGNPLSYDLPTDDVHFAQYRIGGTSLSSPLFAGMMALADQAAGRPHGFANPALYAASGTSAFHDVTSPAQPVAVVRTNYLNNTNASGGTQTVLRTAGDTGTLTSAPGYDDSTGLGTPSGLAFLQALAPASPLLDRLGAAGATSPRTTRTRR